MHFKIQAFLARDMPEISHNRNEIVAKSLSVQESMCCDTRPNLISLRFSFSGEYTISHRFLHITLACAFIIERICVNVFVVFAADSIPHRSKYSCCIVITPLQSGISLPNLISSSYALACPSSVQAHLGYKIGLNFAT